jgi:hypothetical protein
MIDNYSSLSVSLTFLVVSLPPRFSFAFVFFDIMITMIDIRRLITCVGCSSYWSGIRYLNHVLK